jgi:hypothetical protein
VTPSSTEPSKNGWLSVPTSDGNFYQYDLSKIRRGPLGISAFVIDPSQPSGMLSIFLFDCHGHFLNEHGRGVSIEYLTTLENVVRETGGDGRAAAVSLLGLDQSLVAIALGGAIATTDNFQWVDAKSGSVAGIIAKTVCI